MSRSPFFWAPSRLIPGGLELKDRRHPGQAITILATEEEPGYYQVQGIFDDRAVLYDPKDLYDD